MNELFTYPEVAEKLKISTRFIRRLAASGRLKPTRIARRCVRFSEQDITDFLTKQK